MLSIQVELENTVSDRSVEEGTLELCNGPGLKGYFVHCLYNLASDIL